MLELLEEQYGWKIDWNKKILEGPIKRYDADFNPTIVEEVYEKYTR